MSEDRNHNAFIPGWLDDAGLTPGQFRIFCHITRRGDCFESLSAMSRCCHMRRTTIQAALKDLEKMYAITKEKRIGRTCVYTLAPSPKEALGRNMPTQPKRGTTTPPKAGTTPQPKRGTTHLDGKRHYKVYPSKVTPNQVTTTKGRPPELQRQPEQPIRTLTASERISAERQLDRAREQLKQYRNRLPTTATDTLIDDQDRTIMREYRNEIERLEKLTKI